MVFFGDKKLYAIKDNKDCQGNMNGLNCSVSTTLISV